MPPALPAKLSQAAAVVFGLAGTLACAQSTPVEWTVTVDPLPSPATGDTSSPQLTSNGTRAILSWLEVADSRVSLRFAERTSDGWSDARSVVSSADVVANAADVPLVARLDDGRLTALWLGRLGRNPMAYSLGVAFSDDNGLTWSAPVHPHQDDTLTQHGFASIFQPPGAALGLVWLDGRATDPEKPEGENGNMALFAATFDHSGTQISELALDERACDCCQTSATHTTRGVLVAYRDRSPSEVRDIVVLRFEDGSWSEPMLVHEDGWTIHGCPVNGPTIDARGDEVVVAWFTGSTGQGRVLASFSHDAGRSFLPPVRIDDGFPRGRVDVAVLDERSAIVSWTETLAGRPEFRVRVVRDDATLGDSLTIATVAGSDYPRMARTEDELLFSWVTRADGMRHVETARALLP